eukprot:tig00021535_g22225.t1
MEGFDKSTSERVILIAATNHVEMVDGAIYSRFKTRIWFSLPRKMDFQKRLLASIAYAEQKGLSYFFNADVKLKDNVEKFARGCEALALSHRDCTALFEEVGFVAITDESWDAIEAAVKIWGISKFEPAVGQQGEEHGNAAPSKSAAPAVAGSPGLPPVHVEICYRHLEEALESIRFEKLKLEEIERKGKGHHTTNQITLPPDSRKGMRTVMHAQLKPLQETPRLAKQVEQQPAVIKELRRRRQYARAQNEDEMYSKFLRRLQQDGLVQGAPRGPSSTGAEAAGPSAAGVKRSIDHVGGEDELKKDEEEEEEMVDTVDSKKKLARVDDGSSAPSACSAAAGSPPAASHASAARVHAVSGAVGVGAAIAGEVESPAAGSGLGPDGGGGSESAVGGVGDTMPLPIAIVLRTASGSDTFLSPSAPWPEPESQESIPQIQEYASPEGAPCIDEDGDCSMADQEKQASEAGGAPQPETAQPFQLDHAASVDPRAPWAVQRAHMHACASPSAFAATSDGAFDGSAPATTSDGAFVGPAAAGTGADDCEREPRDRAAPAGHGAGGSSAAVLSADRDRVHADWMDVELEAAAPPSTPALYSELASGWQAREAHDHDQQPDPVLTAACEDSGAKFEPLSPDPPAQAQDRFLRDHFADAFGPSSPLSTFDGRPSEPAASLPPGAGAGGELEPVASPESGESPQPAAAATLAPSAAPAAASEFEFDTIEQALASAWFRRAAGGTLAAGPDGDDRSPVLVGLDHPKPEKRRVDWDGKCAVIDLSRVRELREFNVADDIDRIEEICGERLNQLLKSSNLTRGDPELATLRRVAGLDPLPNSNGAGWIRGVWDRDSLPYPPPSGGQWPQITMWVPLIFLRLVHVVVVE